MQRQSLGSPSSKLIHVKNENPTITEPHKQSSISAINGDQLIIKKLKLKPKTISTVITNKPENYYIHLIPMLTLFCFLILYLSSYDPSQIDMAQFNGLKGFTNPRDLEDNNIMDLDIKKGDILKGIRSLKADISKHRRLHRKIPKF